MTGTTVGIAVLLPDLLGTYSDRGNAEVLAQRLRWRGIAAEVRTVTATDAPPDGCELYLVGGGEDAGQRLAADRLRRHPSLRTTLAERAVTLAVCAGMQLLGTSVTERDGTRYAGLDVLDLHTVPGPRRALGEVLARPSLPDVGMVTGFANHGGASTLGPGAAPFARIVRGPGNGPHHPVDGARTPSVEGPGVVATYLHGPVLARNPDLADHLLRRAVGPLPPLDPARVPEQALVRCGYVPAQDRRRGRGWSAPRPRPSESPT
jgi:lipid II isoglutaminyl synthase (glutamine-hydrolysing)